MYTKKTIIYTGGFELPDKNAAAQRVLANAKIFKDLGFNVILVGIDKTLPLDTHIKDTKSSVQEFDTWAIPYPTNKKLWLTHITSNTHIKYIVEHYYKDDLYSVICYNYPAIALYKVKTMCSEKNAFFIPDATEWYESNGGGLLFNIIKWIDTSSRMRFIHPKADGLITTSKYLTHFYKKRNCITVELPTLYDVEMLSLNKSEKKSNDIIKLMYAGSVFNLNRIDKKKTTIKDRLDKIIILLHAVYQEQTNFTFDIYGLNKENYLSVFPEHAVMLNTLCEIITFHGRKPHLEIINAIRASDFTIFLRDIVRVIEAGFPSKFSESISYGTPVISNMISNIEKYVIEGKNSYIIDLDNEEIQVVKMIQILKLNQRERQTMKEYCLAHKIFDYREYINPVKTFIQKVEKYENN